MSHSNHGSHGVSVSGGFTARSHAVTEGVTFIQSIPAGASKELSLQILTGAVNEVRRSLQSPAYTSDATVPTEWDTASLSKLLDYTSGVYYRKYNWGSMRVDTNISGTHVNSYSWNGGAGSKGGNVTSDGTISNNCFSPITSSEYTAHASGLSCNSHLNTAGFQNAVAAKEIFKDLGKRALEIVTYSAEYSVDNAQSILDIINNQKKMVYMSYVPSSGSYSTTGHANHSNCKRDYKTDIKPLSEEFDATSLIEDLKLVSFKYKENLENYDPSILHYGFIADDTSEHFATQYHDRLDYLNCIGLLLKSVQELSSRVRYLEGISKK